MGKKTGKKPQEEPQRRDPSSRTDRHVIDVNFKHSLVEGLNWPWPRFLLKRSWTVEKDCSVPSWPAGGRKQLRSHPVHKVYRTRTWMMSCTQMMKLFIYQRSECFFHRCRGDGWWWVGHCDPDDSAAVWPRPPPDQISTPAKKRLRLCPKSPTHSLRLSDTPAPLMTSLLSCSWNVNSNLHVIVRSAMHDGKYCLVSDHRLYTTFHDALWDTLSHYIGYNIPH